jgi:hypothetical protein
MGLLRNEGQGCNRAAEIFGLIWIMAIAPVKGKGRQKGKGMQNRLKTLHKFKWNSNDPRTYTKIIFGHSEVFNSRNSIN